MSESASRGIGKGRIEALADGVFAIAMTLLVLDVKVPAVDGSLDTAGFVRALWQLWPRFFAFVVSFLIAGVFWVGHHAQMHYVRRSDRLFMWSNLLFLLFISTIPFSASLLGQYTRQPVAISIYCAKLILAGVVLYAQLRYAAGRGGLFDADMDPRLVRQGGQRILMGPAIYTVAAGAAFFSPSLSLILCVLTPLLYLLPGRVDRHWKPAVRKVDGESLR
jgi:uncharacterized membrane protein